MVSNWLAFGISLGGALSLLGAVEQLSKLKVLASRHVRKTMHICTGIVYMLTWVNYDDYKQPNARWLAASVPALITLRFAAVGAGLLPDAKLVASATRHGDRRELLRGPLLYGVVHALMTLLGWRRSPAALVGLSALCAGDGAAELVGRALGHRTPALPYNKDKTMAGSVACAMAAWLASIPMVALFNARGHFDHTLTTAAIVRGCAACAGLAAAVESLPVREVDNLTVPLATAWLAAYGGVFR